MGDEGDPRVSSTPGRRGGDQSASSGLVLSKAHLVSTTTHMGEPLTARQTILQAVDTLETENERLHELNEQMAGELDELRRENAQLKRQLELYRNEADAAKQHQGKLQHDNLALQQELERHASHLAQEAHRFKEHEMMVHRAKQENTKILQEMEALREESLAKDRQLKAALHELQAVTGKLDRASRRNFNDRDIELLHEVELLKEEKRDLLLEKEALAENNQKLCNEMANLQNTLDQQLSELKNENRRHALLTKEFNSLLEENNHLKLQLRRRNRHGTVQSSKDADPIETVQKINRESPSLASARKYHSSTSLPITREASSFPVEDISSRDLSLSSKGILRERTGLRRQGSSQRLSNHGNQAGSREGSGDSQRGSAEDGSPANSDTLPSISAASARTWKP